MTDERAITASGTGEPILWLGGAWSRAHALLAAKHRVIAPDPADAAGAAASIGHFDLVGEGAAARDALLLALARPEAVRALVLIGPTVIARDGSAADAALAARLGALKLPSLALFGTLDAAAPVEAARHYRQRMPGCNLVFIYDAGPAMAEDRPEAVASLILDFLERHDLFLVRRDSDLIHP